MLVQIGVLLLRIFPKTMERDYDLVGVLGVGGSEFSMEESTDSLVFWGFIGSVFGLAMSAQDIVLLLFSDASAGVAFSRQASGIKDYSIRGKKQETGSSPE